jgi:hypothetical protein
MEEQKRENQKEYELADHDFISKGPEFGLAAMKKLALTLQR